MKQVKLTPNEWNGNITKEVQLEEKCLFNSYFQTGAYLVVTRYDGIYELEWHRGIGDQLLKRAKRLSTINKVANQYGIEFVLD